jgi:hypothetical protein
MTLRTLSAALCLSTLVALPAAAADIDVGVSIGISQPGVYGRIDIGRFPQPQVVYPQPVIVVPPRVVIAQPQPVYMWVPPGHRKNWRKHCQSYGACGSPVVFVRDDWYEHNVYPQGKGRGHDKGHGKGRGRDD